MNIWKTGRARSTLAGMALLCLAACSGGEPGAAEMKEAIANNPRLMMTIGMALQANAALGDGTQSDPAAALDAATIEKGSCAAASGASGFVCDFRIGIQANGHVQFGPWSKARFYSANGSWQIEQ